MTIKYLVAIGLLAACSHVRSQDRQAPFHKEQHRPQVHFTPREKWMNDPNGMVYHKGIYHLFYQYYPGSTVWGPMHWGHATSKNLVHWQQQPIALYPDSLGYIFSGSAVVDGNNSSGFGKNGKAPLVAIFTHHDTTGEKAGRDDFQYQSIAYSLDDGRTWEKYAGNPVLQNPGIRDFRDPKVIWHEGTRKWIMVLATKDRVTFYSSVNLKEWTKESEFGETVGAHGGVWECPDLVALEHEGKKVWVLIVSINPGGPNGGSATQYFTGNFDGKSFIPFQTDTRWVDHGPDNYAGVTWANTGKRKIFMGWMSNWQYATLVPTQNWRSAMTIPRELSIKKMGEKYLLSSKPVTELTSITGAPAEVGKSGAGAIKGAVKMSLKMDKATTFSITLSNPAGQKVIIGYDKPSNNYFIDRTTSGKVSFEEGFAGKHTAPRLSRVQALDLTLIIDNASVELFADDGLTAMTAIFFPDAVYSKFSMQTADRSRVTSFRISPMRSLWDKSSIASK